jgi:hypothetical protein
MEGLTTCGLPQNELVRLFSDHFRMRTKERDKKGANAAPQGIAYLPNFITGSCKKDSNVAQGVVTRDGSMRCGQRRKITTDSNIDPMYNIKIMKRNQEESYRLHVVANRIKVRIAPRLEHIP